MQIWLFVVVQRKMFLLFMASKTYLQFPIIAINQKSTLCIQTVLLTLRPSDAYMRQYTPHPWFK